MSTTHKHTGVCKFYNSEKQFGFIKSDDSDAEYFVHKTGIKNGKTIHEGDSVQFNLEEGKKGKQAVAVEVI